MSKNNFLFKTSGPAFNPIRRRIHSDILNSFQRTVGNTPLIKLEHISRESGCTILVKCEQMNRTGSVKDRAAFFLVKDAIQRRTLILDSNYPAPCIVEVNY